AHPVGPILHAAAAFASGAGARLLSRRALALRLLPIRLLTLGLRLPTLHFARQLLRFLAQLHLFAREFLQLAFQVGFAQLPGELLLFPQKLVLPPREFANLVEQARIRVLLLLRSVSRLVIGLLRALQLLVEERRDVVVPVVVARTARARLLSGHLPPLHLGLCLEKRIERRHLGRQRVGRFQP